MKSKLLSSGENVEEKKENAKNQMKESTTDSTKKAHVNKNSQSAHAKESNYLQCLRAIVVKELEKQRYWKI